MSGITIEVNGLEKAVAEAEKTLSAFGGKNAARTLAQAINQCLAQGRKEAAEIARKAYTAPAGKLFDNIVIKRAKASRLAAELTLKSRRGVSLIHFRAKPALPGKKPAAGVSVKIKRAGSRHVKMSETGGSKPFIMRKMQGGFGVFVRHGKDKFEMLYGPSPIQALQKKDAAERVAEKIEAAFMPALQAQLDRLISGGRK